MKKIYLIILVLTLLTLNSCNLFKSSRVELFCINYSVREVKTKKTYEREILRIDEEKQRFIWSFETNDLEKENYFSFSFSGYELDNLPQNSNEFEYITSTDEKLSFESCKTIYGEYKFTGSIIIYIYYNNASDKVKELIDKKDNSTTINICETHWLFDKSTINYETNEVITY